MIKLVKKGAGENKPAPRREADPRETAQRWVNDFKRERKGLPAWEEATRCGRPEGS